MTFKVAGYSTLSPLNVSRLRSGPSASGPADHVRSHRFLHPGRPPRLRRPSRERLHRARRGRDDAFAHRLHAGQHRQIRGLGVRDHDPGLSAGAADRDQYQRLAAHLHRDLRRAAVRHRLRDQRCLRLCDDGTNGRRRSRDADHRWRLRARCRDLRPAGRHAAWSRGRRPAPGLVPELLWIAPFVGAVLLLWAIYELVRLWRTRPPGSTLRSMVLAPAIPAVDRSPPDRACQRHDLSGLRFGRIHHHPAAGDRELFRHPSAAGLWTLDRARRRRVRHAGLDLAAAELPHRLAAALVVVAQHHRRHPDGARHGAACPAATTRWCSMVSPACRRTRCRPMRR